MKTKTLKKYQRISDRAGYRNISDMQRHFYNSYYNAFLKDIGQENTEDLPQYPVYYK